MSAKRFDYSFIWQGMIPAKVVRLAQAIQALNSLSGIREQQYVALHEELKKIAMIQSVKSSNAIEGIITTDARVREIVTKSSAPLNHDEEEIAGYRDALALIHRGYRDMPFDLVTILRLHEVMLRYTGDMEAGQFKSQNNLILESDNTGNRKVRFYPSSAADTPDDMMQMFLAYQEALPHVRENALLLIPCLVFDFLSIHPFSDGNGRMSRLLSLLLLYQHGYNIGRFISLEAQISATKNAYYQSLHESSHHWQENTHDYFPFVEYFLTTLLLCYRDMDKRFGLSQSKKSNKKQRIEAVLLNSLLPMSKADICELLPDVSPHTVEAVLGSMVHAGLISRVGAGRGSRYIRN